MDLAILAAYEDVFSAYEDAIRKEFAHVSDADFRKGRTQVLEKFLKRPRIFLTEPFSAMEFSARHNIEDALERLRRQETYQASLQQDNLAQPPAAQ